MWWCFSTFLLLLLLAIQQLHGQEQKEPAYLGPVVCTGTKPLIIHENYANIIVSDEEKKLYYEQYWYQIYNHLFGCEIIVGNLIIPHQHDVLFETELLNKAIEQIEIVTGYIYIHDVALDLNFKNLKMVYGNELFYYPSTWSGYQDTEDFKRGYAIFVEKFAAKTLSMPELRYIKNGFIGFKETPYACVWKQEFDLIDFGQIFDSNSTEPVQRVFRLSAGVFTKCVQSHYQCTISGCNKCYVDAFGSGSKTCQKTTKLSCDCKNLEGVSPDFCSAPGRGACCPQHSRGGCYGDKNHAVFCEDGYYLQIPVNGSTEQRTCHPICYGKVIEGTNICLDDSDYCPDYMFYYGARPKKCSYRCPDGYEMDPIGNFDLNDPERIDPKFLLYFAGKNRCKPCRMEFDNDKKEFVTDCGISCVIQSNSLSFVTILNIYPAITEIKDYDFQTFKNIFIDVTDNTRVKTDSHIFSQKCRHIFGFLHIDKYSVGYPGDAVRLIPEHFRVLTYATGLYGNIRIEDTEGYWFAEPFRNLLVIQKPMKGKIAYDQEQFEEYGVMVRYNSDLRTVDLQRLRYMHGNIVIQYNPLYIPPRKKLNETHVYDVFEHVQKDDYDETVTDNGLDITRAGKKITYDSGCTNDEVAFYYKRCVRCAEEIEVRSFEEKAPKEYDIKELFAQCKPKADCKTTEGEYILQRDGEEQCLKCSPQCLQCTDHTPFSCFDKTNQTKFACRGHEINEINMRACAPVKKVEDDGSVAEGNKFCLNGFAEEQTGDIKKCARCNSSCIQCHSNEKDDNGNVIYGVPGSGLEKGCKGCGFAFLAKQNNGDWIGVCGYLGAPPRYPPGEKPGNYFINNPVRRLFNYIKPSKLTKPINYNTLDYGET